MLDRRVRFRRAQRKAQQNAGIFWFNATLNRSNIMSKKFNVEREVKKLLGGVPTETRRVEFKLHVDLSTNDQKAEFIRDILSLANSEGESPRDPGLLIIGFKGGIFRKPPGLESASVGQLISSNITPDLRFEYKEIRLHHSEDVCVLCVYPDVSNLYLAQKELRNANNQRLLAPGECWGRKHDRKYLLTGSEIVTAAKGIEADNRRRATRTLNNEIKRLKEQVSDGGASLEVKKLRFEILSFGDDWDRVADGYRRLLPFATNFDSQKVKHEVIDTIYHHSHRVRFGLPANVVSAMLSILEALYPEYSVGRQERLTKDEKSIFERCVYHLGDMLYDCCKYQNDAEILRLTTRAFGQALRVAFSRGDRQYAARLIKKLRGYSALAQHCEFSVGAAAIESEIVLELDEYHYQENLRDRRKRV